MDLTRARHAFVTGGASGIGLGLVRAFAARGVAVTAADIDEGALDAVLPTLPGRSRGARLDVADRAGWAAAKADAEAAFGPVDILVNNAGVTAVGIDLADMVPESFDRIIAIDLVGVFNGVHSFAADMRERRHGHIVNTSSMAGITAPMRPVGGGYVTAKFGVAGLSETLRMELAPYGVGVSTLCPGMVESGIFQNTLRLGGGGLVSMPTGDLSEAGRRAGNGHQFDPAGAAAMVLQGIAGDAPYIVTPAGDWWSAVEARHSTLREAFATAGMLEPHASAKGEDDS
jgi:NAD(P)-dependent dehydrogenase (short-subunit alcohol dehydrogenase family)